MDARTEYLLRTDCLGEDEVDDVGRRILAVVADEVDALECDIPWADRDAWPPEVVAAAEVLMSIRPPRRPDPAYWQTREVRPVPVEVWEAFVSFVPYTYDASCWSADRVRVVSAPDGVSSLLVALRREQVDQLDPRIVQLLDRDVKRNRRWRRSRL